jgi:hypothetical protein
MSLLKASTTLFRGVTFAAPPFFRARIVSEIIALIYLDCASIIKMMEL